MFQQLEVTTSVEDPDFAVGNGLDNERRPHSAHEPHLPVEVAGSQFYHGAGRGVGMNGVHEPAMDVTQTRGDVAVFYHNLFTNVKFRLEKKRDNSQRMEIVR